MKPLRLFAALLAFAAAASAQVSSERLVKAADDPENWLTYSGSYNSQRHSKLDQITRDVLGWWNTDAVDEERRERLVSGPRSLMAREPEILAAWSARM